MSHITCYKKRTNAIAVILCFVLWSEYLDPLKLFFGLIHEDMARHPKYVRMLEKKRHPNINHMYNSIYIYTYIHRQSYINYIYIHIAYILLLHIYIYILIIAYKVYPTSKVPTPNLEDAERFQDGTSSPTSLEAKGLFGQMVAKKSVVNHIFTMI